MGLQEGERGDIEEREKFGISEAAEKSTSAISTSSITNPTTSRASVGRILGQVTEMTRGSTFNHLVAHCVELLLAAGGSGKGS